MLRKVVDLGYLAYHYAGKLDLWELEKHLYYARNGCVMANESSHNFRKVYNPQYKANRVHRDDDYHLKARALWKSIVEDDNFLCVSIHGLEGDDIIALYHVHYGVSVISKDKDFHTLPDLFMQDIFENSRKISDLILPKTYNSVDWNYNKWLLHLAINGDASDNVMRLSVPGIQGLKVERDILLEPDNEKMFDTAFKEFGDMLLYNLFQVTLPMPLWAGVDEYKLFALLSSNVWYDYVKKNTVI
jgi:hypothetical protein